MADETTPLNPPKQGKDPAEQAFNALREQATKALSSTMKTQADKVIAADKVLKNEIAEFKRIAEEAQQEYQRNLDVFEKLKAA